MESRGVGCCTAFEGFRRIATGSPAEVAAEVRGAADRGGREAVLVFDDATGEQVELDVRGVAGGLAAGVGGVADATAEEGPRGRGRPRLGVVAREVTLLPRHWDWLNGQPGGASVALRKLVDEARRANEGKDRARRSREAAYRFMSALAGNLPGFEEASRALFAGDVGRLDGLVAGWPEDVRAYLLRLARDSPGPEAVGTTAGPRSAGD